MELMSIHFRKKMINKFNYDLSLDWKDEDYYNNKTPIEFNCLECGYKFKMTPKAMFNRKHCCSQCLRKDIDIDTNKYLQINISKLNNLCEIILIERDKLPTIENIKALIDFF